MQESETGGLTVNYTYDSAGNRTQMTVTGTERYGVEYTYDANNRLTQEVRAGEATLYTYDDNGNLLRKGTVDGAELYEYNGFNQLVILKQGEGGAAYGYNASGIRVSKQVGDTYTYYLLDGGDPNAEMDGETIFEEVDFDVFFGAVEQENRQLYSSVVHCWLVMLAYGGKYQNKNVVTVFKEYDSQTVFDLKKLKNHRDYSFGLSHEADGVTIHIYDKKTLWEVVRG